jgi:hypothetical protein
MFDWFSAPIVARVGCGLLQGEAGILIELLDWKTRGLVFQIALLWWFPERAHQIFGEMSVRI